MAEAALPPTASTQSRPTAIVAVVVAKGRDLLALRAGLSFPIYIFWYCYIICIERTVTALARSIASEFIRCKISVSVSTGRPLFWLAPLTGLVRHGWKLGSGPRRRTLLVDEFGNLEQQVAFGIGCNRVGEPVLNPIK